MTRRMLKDLIKSGERPPNVKAEGYDELKETTND